MAFLSKLYGRQVNKAAQLAAHKGIGSLLTFDSSTDFPTPSELCQEKVLCGLLVGKPSTGSDKESDPSYAIQEYFNYADTSTRNLYVDCDKNIVYRWKHYTLEDWKKEHWEQDENEQYIEPVRPLRVDYDSDEEYEEALADYEASLYPTTDVPDASQGWTYVPCAGGGGGDLYWEQF